jgi:hypothetical protein
VSAERALPWWASDGPVDGGVDRASDPVERHRAARRGAYDPAGVAPDEAADEADPDDEVAPAEASRQHVDACGVCPFCASLRLLQDSRPELVEHLTEAARHLAAAARSLLDTPVPSGAERADGASARRPSEGPRGRPSPADGRLQRIVLDDGPPGSSGSPGSPGRSGPRRPPGDPPGDPVGGS